MGVVAKAIEQEQARGAGFLSFHYARLYNMIKPTRAAVFINGRIAVNGGVDLIEKSIPKATNGLSANSASRLKKITDEAMNTVSIGACATRVAVNHDGK
jgi:Fe-S cluster assembly ATPase SufC